MPPGTYFADHCIVQPQVRQTQAQAREYTEAVYAFSKAASALRAEQIEQILGEILPGKYGPARAERMGDAIARAAHMAGRGK